MFLIKQTIFFPKVNSFFLDEYLVLCGNKSLLS